MIKRGDKTKVLVIGIDGATFDIIDPLLAEGKLPALDSMIQHGYRGILDSTIPPTCAPAWASFMTGKSPGKHGVYDVVRFQTDSYDPILTTGEDIKSKTLWQILSEHNKTLIAVNVPLTYPPQKVNGIIVSNAMMSHDDVFTYPPDLSAKLYETDYVVDSTYHNQNGVESYYQFIDATVKKQFEVFRDLITHQNWDFSMIVFVAPDRMQHAMWKRKDLLEEMYVKLDEYIGELLDMVGTDTTTIAMSDHGFNTTSKIFFINQWLMELGLLKIVKGTRNSKASTSEFSSILFGKLRGDGKNGNNQTKLNLLLAEPLSNLFKGIIPTTKVKHWFNREYVSIDWPHTRAYVCSRFSFGIHVNLRGRQPQGIVEPGREYEELRSFLIRELYKLKDPQTFENVINDVYRSHEIYYGKYYQEAPDLIVLPREFKYFLDPDIKKTTKGLISRSGPSSATASFHNTRGIFLAKGSEIKNKQVVSNLSIMDLAPTILHLLGLPVPEDMDGKILYPLMKSDTVVFSQNEKLPSLKNYTRPGEETYEKTHEEMISRESEERGVYKN